MTRMITQFTSIKNIILASTGIEMLVPLGLVQKGLLPRLTLIPMPANISIYNILYYYRG